MPAVDVIQSRRGTASEWVIANPILAPGEFGFEIDTRKLKLGDGTSVWTDLEYQTAEAAPFALDAVTDVTLTAPSVGQVLKFNGTVWVNDDDETGSAGVTDGDKGDITVSGSGATWTIDSAAKAAIIAEATNATQAELDAVTAAKADTSHAHAASDVTSGTVATARLGSGTANSTTFLRGDQTWATPAGGGVSLTVQEGDSTVDASVTTLDFGAGFDVTSSPAGEANIALDLTEYTGGYHADVATQAELDAHVSDSSAAHAASAISYAGGTGMSATDVEAAIDELATEKADASALSSYLLKAAAGAAVENLGAVEFNVNVVAATGATETLDTSLYATHDCTMDQACTFTFSNPAPSGKETEFKLILRGAFTPTLPAAVDWPDGAAPTYTTPSEYVFSTTDAGTTWRGSQRGKAFA